LRSTRLQRLLEIINLNVSKTGEHGYVFFPTGKL
jgi:hypothetical protein